MSVLRHTRVTCLTCSNTGLGPSRLPWIFLTVRQSSRSLGSWHTHHHTAAIILCIYDYEVRTRQHASNVNVKSRMYDDMLHNIMLKWKIWIWNQENCFGKTLAICLSKIMRNKLTVHKASYEQVLRQHFLAHQFCWLEYPWVWYNRHFNGISTCRLPDLCLLLSYQCLMARRPKQVKLSHKSPDFKTN